MFKNMRPSQARHWVACPGFAALTETVVTNESDAMKDGTLAHEYAHRLLDGETVDIPDDEMRDAVREYIGYVPTNSIIEQELSLDIIAPGMTGTPDAWFYSEGWLSIVDFKYGHSYVEVEHNLQLLCYVAGLAVQLALTGDTAISMTIVQPRCYGHESVRTWRTTLGEIGDEIFAIQDAAREALSGNAPCRTGPQCTYCHGAHLCTAMQTQVMSFVDRSDPRGLTLDQAARELSILNLATMLIKSRQDALGVQIEYGLKSGQSVAGWTLSSGRSTQKWRISPEEVVTLGQCFGADLSKPGTLTPKQAVKAGVPESVVNDPAVTEVASGALKLAPILISDAIKKELLK